MGEWWHLDRVPPRRQIVDQEQSWTRLPDSLGTNKNPVVIVCRPKAAIWQVRARSSTLPLCSSIDRDGGLARKWDDQMRGRALQGEHLGHLALLSATSSLTALGAHCNTGGSRGSRTKPSGCSFQLRPLPTANKTRTRKGPLVFYKTNLLNLAFVPKRGSFRGDRVYDYTGTEFKPSPYALARLNL